MPQIQIVEQLAYNPDLARDYDELLASLHLVDSYVHSPAEIYEVCTVAGSNFYLGMLGDIAVSMATLIKPVVSIGHKTAIVEDVAVQRKYREDGFGTAMMAFIETEAKRLGANRIELHSSDLREEAHSLYKKIGFQVFDTNLFRKELVN